MMDADERELFAAGVRAAMERHAGSDVDAALAELGWTDALEVDPRSAVSTLFELQGRARVASRALDDVVLRALGAAVDAGVVLPALGASDPPGTRGPDGVTVRGVASGAGAARTALLVATADHEVHVIATADLEVRPVGGLDPSLGLVEVRGVAAPAQADAGGWTGAVAAGRLALGHEIVGAARSMLELARDHALQRVQFGRPIAMFQAVRHRLAETLVSIEAADAALAAAWDDASPTTALMAKATSGRAARLATRHCQQVLAGIGFTTEHPFQGYLRRVFVLDQLLGSSRGLTAELGRSVLAAGAPPPLLPL